ncbi:OmpA family protein [Flectobacillus sp. DC10W]|uniref:OmpA family protein n=1 Tax=Flectobacillus longus TaxID=2984207 RepID=A0ABT6YRY9_9BACT|nr:OmpA family protein [Flectobacillus longus]MDI9866359.1 OmpA family protein [Flectobacillus longus]
MVNTFFFRFALVVTLLIFTQEAFSQAIKWANTVIEYSSEFVLPLRAKTANTNLKFSPITSEFESLTMKFDTTFSIRQVMVSELMPQGSIAQVWAIDALTKEHLLFEISEDASLIPGKDKLFNVILPKMTEYKVQAIRLVLRKNALKTSKQIEAIGISNSAQVVNQFVKVASDAPQRVIRENLGKTVNSKNPEFAPVISSDGKTLYYTRNYISLFGKEKDQDIWYSTKNNDGTWSKAQNLGIPLNTDDNNAVFAVSSDGREVLLMNKYQKDGKLAPGISRSKRTPNGWSFPEEVKIDNFYNYSPNAEFAISPDGRVMVMSVQRMTTKGKRDLYVSFKKNNDEWTEPRQMGNTLNSIEHDVTPFIAADGKTLYFSSRGFSGFGDNDIFKSTRLDETWLNWSEPQNLGEGINTPNWDGFFTIPASGEYAYMCTYEGNAQKEDIFRLLLPEDKQPDPVWVLMGEILSTTDQKAIECDVEWYTNKNYKKKNVTHFNPSLGLFKIILPLHQQYEIVPVKKGYLTITDYFDLTNENEFKEIKKNFFLLPLEVGNKGVLNSLTFNQGKADLHEAALRDLDRIAQAMKEIPTLEILFEGHTDNQGDFQLNLQLSEDRVRNAKKYLISQGIQAERIQTKGWGQTRAIASNATEERRKLNRRVEFTIIKK